MDDGDSDAYGGADRMLIKTALADLSTGIVVVQVHKCPGRVASLGSPLPRVDERLGKSAAVSDVVRTAGPLEAVGGARSLNGPVTAAAVQEPGAARSCDGVGHTGCRNGMHERRLPGTCNDQQCRPHHWDACQTRLFPDHPRRRVGVIENNDRCLHACNHYNSRSTVLCFLVLLLCYKRLE